MFTIYVYVPDTLADWELGYVTSELNSGRFFKKDAERVALKTVSYSKEPVITMGGMKIVPDCLTDDIVVSEKSILLLPGANTWNDKKHGAIIEKAGELLSSGATVCAICGATTALANFGLLNNRPHRHIQRGERVPRPGKARGDLRSAPGKPPALRRNAGTLHGPF